MTPALLEELTRMSHRLGTPRYVLGGGGNSSAKDETTLWIKPSGTTLPGMTASSFVAVDRKALGALYDWTPPEDPAAREAGVKDIVQRAVESPTGRPSVETPLHDSFDTTYVMHTHPAEVNGMTCAAGGRQVAGKLFDDALWVDYTDPGYTLSMTVRRQMHAWRDRHGTLPRVVLMENHGVIVGGQSVDEVVQTYREMLDRLDGIYDLKDIPTTLAVGDPPAADESERIAELYQSAFAAPVVVAPSGFFDVARGPISPDHIVYHKSEIFIGEVSADALKTFADRTGYPPRVVADDSGVYGLGPDGKQAQLALAFARDGALVKQLAEAFGGITYLDDRSAQFIENWEVEQYRRKVSGDPHRKDPT